MAGGRTSIAELFYSGVNSIGKIHHVKSHSSYMNLSRCIISLNRYSTMVGHPVESMSGAEGTKRCKISYGRTSSHKYPPDRCFYRNIYLRKSSLFPVCINGMFTARYYSSNIGGKPGGRQETVISNSTANNANLDGSDWTESLKNSYQSVLDASIYAKEKAIEASDGLVPYVQKLMDSYPYLRNVIIPVGGTLFATLLAWMVMPRLMRRLQKYSMQGPAVLLYGNVAKEKVPYEKSIWGALEDPVRYLITFMSFSQLGALIAPTTIASQYITQAWRGAVVLSFVWFLYRWKTNVFSRALATQSIAGADREKVLALDKISSVGLLGLGVMASAEACGVAVQSILTVGGIGGVATAFAARDILGNMLSGLSMQFSKPFSVGDTIKAGSIEGQVVEMGLTTTSLLNSEKFPVIVPNSLFSSQALVNKSRAEWRAMVTKIPLQMDDLKQISQLSEDIKSMLRSDPKVFLGNDQPFCFLSRIEKSFAELTIGCNLKRMRKEDLYSAQQDILLQSAQIIKQHGVQLGISQPE